MEFARLPRDVRFLVYDYLLPYRSQLDLDWAFKFALDDLELAHDQARADAADFSPVPGSTSPILDVSREIRDNIYDHLLRYDEQNDRNHSSALMVWHGVRRGPTACIGARALALVNRAIRDEFYERFNVRAVHYIPMDLSGRNGLMQVRTISGPLAGVWRMHLYTEYISEHSVWHGLTADRLSVPVLLFNLMADCSELTELMCTFEGGMMPFDVHRKIVEVVEGLPKLRRYVINTGHIKSWARRTSAKMGWILHQPRAPRIWRLWDIAQDLAESGGTLWLIYRRRWFGGSFS